MRRLAQLTAAALATSFFCGAAPARAQVTSEPSAVVFPDPAKFATGLYTEGEFGGLWFNGPAGNDIGVGFAVGARVGYDQDVPWISRDKVHIEVSYKVTNLSDEKGDFTLWIDGANEYTKYDTQAASAALGGDDPIFFPLVTTTQRLLDAGATFSGIVREDDFAEGELDLDALGRWNDADPGSPTFAGVLINRSEVNPVGLNLVPANLVVPAMFEIDVRLKTNVPMRVEYYVRVRDDDDRLWHNDADDVYEPAPALYNPPALM